MNDGEARRDSSTWLQILHQGPQGRRGGRGAAKGLRSGEGGTNRIDIAAGASGDFHHAYPLGSPSLLSPSTLCCRSSPPSPLQANASEYTKMPHYHWVVRNPTNKEYGCFKFEKDGASCSYLHL